MYCKNCSKLLNDEDKFCSSCGSKSGEGNSYCSNCGSIVNEGDNNCSNCGVAIEINKIYDNVESNTNDYQPNNQESKEDTGVYTYQQTNQNYSSTANTSTANDYSNGYYNGKQQKSKIVAGILGILVGGLGIHRFYLGYIGLGFLQIALTIFTCGMASIWGFIEGILILCGSGITTDADGVPLSDR